MHHAIERRSDVARLVCHCITVRRFYHKTMDLTTDLPENWGINIANKQPEAIALLNRIYKALFNQTIQQGCGNCYQKAYYRVQKYLYLQQQNNPSKQETMTIIKRKYLLKPGRSLQTSFGGDTLTNDNLTDEAAEKLLEKHPTLALHFDVLPDATSEKFAEPE